MYLLASPHKPSFAFKLKFSSVKLFIWASLSILYRLKLSLMFSREDISCSNFCFSISLYNTINIAAKVDPKVIMLVVIKILIAALFIFFINVNVFVFTPFYIWARIKGLSFSKVILPVPSLSVLQQPFMGSQIVFFL